MNEFTKSCFYFLQEFCRKIQFKTVIKEQWPYGTDEQFSSNFYNK